MSRIPVVVHSFLVHQPKGWFLVMPLHSRALKIVPPAAKRLASASTRKAPKRRNVAKGGR